MRWNVVVPLLLPHKIKGIIFFKSKHLNFGFSFKLKWPHIELGNPHSAHRSVMFCSVGGVLTIQVRESAHSHRVRAEPLILASLDLIFFFTAMRSYLGTF